MESGIKTVTTSLGDRSYDILIGSGILAEAGAHLKSLLPGGRAIIISDEHVASRYLHRLSNALAEENLRFGSIILPPGETTKSLSGLELLLQRIFEQEPDRKTALIALGGGVVGDITGFAASIVLRGLPFIQIPTTLLAQVDSSVGGKTGINSSFGKNTIGSFYQPRRVLIDVQTLGSLPRRELLAGYAEVVKYGLLGDKALFEWLEKQAGTLIEGNAAIRMEAIAASCTAKAAIVSADEREESGRRALLNLGHTFAHALEIETGFSQELLHGEAVAIGMALAFRLSAQLGLCPLSDAQRVARHLTEVGLRADLQQVRPEWNTEALIKHCFHDKKADHGKLTFILARGIGDAFVEKDVPVAALRQLLQTPAQAA